MSDDPHFYTVAEVARIFRFKDSTYYVDRNKRQWPHIRIGGQTLFTEAHVEAIAALHSHDPSTPPKPETAVEEMRADVITRGTKR